jgi:hypothetical protein
MITLLAMITVLATTSTDLNFGQQIFLGLLLKNRAAYPKIFENNLETIYRV